MLKEQVNHVVELNGSDAKNQIISNIRLNPQVRSNAVRYLDKREAMISMSQEIDTSLISGTDNPFLDVIVFKSTASADIADLHKEILGLTGVSSVYAQDLQFDQIKRNFYKLGWFFLAAASIFSLLAMALIFSTLQLQLYSDRFELKTMELVGAQDRFIKMPYLRRAVFLGTKATINAAFFLLLIFLLIKIGWPSGGAMLNVMWLIFTILIIWVLGVLFLWICSNFLIPEIFI